MSKEGTEVIEDSPLLSPSDMLGKIKTFRENEKRNEGIRIRISWNTEIDDRAASSEKLVFARRTGGRARSIARKLFASLRTREVTRT